MREIINIDAEILPTVSTRPESLKHELLHYAKYLIENHSKEYNECLSVTINSFDNRKYGSSRLCVIIFAYRIVKC